MPLTETQAKYVERFIETGSVHSVAIEFGVTHGTISEHISTAKRMCAETKARLEEATRKRKEKRTTSADVPPATALLELVESQKYQCALTGESIRDPASASLDHKQPRGLGGSNELENLQWVLKEVNDMKGTLTQERFIELCCKVADHSRRHQ